MDFKILTLNCWGLAVVSKNRKDRIKAIAEMLALSIYDVVCLQELWVESDYQLIKSKISGSLPYSHYFYSGVTGSGICVFSKHSIQEVLFHQWAVNGYIHKLHHGDWFGGKGVGLIKLKINNYNINIYSAHLHAEYHRDCDEYQAHRVLQAFDTAQFIKMTSIGADLAVLAGDLNTEPGDLSYRIILTIPGLIDAYNEATEEAQQCVATNESPLNSYTPKNLVKSNIPGKRIDYILYHPGRKLKIELKKYQLPLPSKVPGCPFSYSDHEAVFANLYISQSEIVDVVADLDLKRGVLEESVSVCDEALKNLSRDKILYWFFTFVLAILLVVSLIFDSPFAYAHIYYVLNALLAIVMAYSFIMAFIWNKIERNAIWAGKLAMEINLRNLQNS